MANILFATWDGGGNVAPASALAGELMRRGHEVRFIGHEAQQEGLRSNTSGVRAYQRARPFTADIGNAPLTLLGVFGDRGMGADVLDELAACPADLVVVDCMLFGVMDALRSRGIGYVVLEHLHDRFLRGSLLKGPIGIGLRAKGFAPVRLLDSASTTFVATLPELDPLPDGPRNREQIGPLVHGTPATATEPTILVSLSTFGYRAMPALLQRIVDAVGDLGVRGIVTTGPLIEPSALHAGSGVEIHAYVPHSELMPHVSAVVGHGGHSTTMLALAHDLPVLVLPLSRLGDQPGVGRSVQNAGAGATLRRRARRADLRTAIEDLLTRDSIRTAAARLGADIRRLDAITAGADRVESMIGDAAHAGT